MSYIDVRNIPYQQAIGMVMRAPLDIIKSTINQIPEDYLLGLIQRLPSNYLIDIGPKLPDEIHLRLIPKLPPKFMASIFYGATDAFLLTMGKKLHGKAIRDIYVHLSPEEKTRLENFLPENRKNLLRGLKT